MHTQQPTTTAGQPDLRTHSDAAAGSGNQIRTVEPTVHRGADEANNDRRQDSVIVPRESKPGIRTSEFWIMLAVVGATLLATYADEDSLARVDGWRFAAAVVVAYIVSRGLAKIGTADRKVQDLD